MPHPLPWYVAAPLIGLTVPLLLLIGNKAFGVSSNSGIAARRLRPAGSSFSATIGSAWAVEPDPSGRHLCRGGASSWAATKSPWIVLNRSRRLTHSKSSIRHTTRLSMCVRNSSGRDRRPPPSPPRVAWTPSAHAARHQTTRV